MSPKAKKRRSSNIIYTKSRDLLKRRFPQILGAYLACSWGILECVDWLVNRYVLSPYLVDFSLVILLSMIPTVALLAYFHGRPGKKWPRFEKIGIPTNMFASVLLLVFIFHNKDLGAATASVTLVNEEGEQIERVIPKSEFRKMIFVFFFDNESADPTLNWLQYGITDLLGWDLEQDPFLYSLTGRFGLIKEYEPGYSEGIGLPLTLKRKIAKHWDHDYFLSGSFAKKDGGLIVTISLYETKRCKLIKERAFEGKDIFELVDRISVQLKRDLGIPSHYIETVEDLPVSEMMTNSIPAFKKYSLGLNASQFHNDYETAVRYLEESVKEDSTFALGYFMLHHHYRYNLGHSKEAEKAMSATMKYVYRLSEKSQFYFKELYYDMRGESDKKFALLKMVVELYPDEAWAHSSLAWEHETRNQLDDALIEYKRVLELEPECDLNLRIIAGIYKKKGEFEQALRYYEEWAERDPDEFWSFAVMGHLYRTFGYYDQAKFYYQRALLVEPENAFALGFLAHIEVRLGNFKKALEEYQEALEASRSPKHRQVVYNGLRYFYELRGQVRKALEYLDLTVEEEEKLGASAWRALIKKLGCLGLYMKAGKKDAAVQVIKDAEKQLLPGDKEWIPRGYMTMYLELEDVENAEEALEHYEKAIEALRFEYQRHIALHARGRIHEMKGEYKQAIENYQEELELEPTDWDINTSIGRCYRNLGDLRKAEKHIKKTLEILPFDPKAHYEIALVYADMGKKEKALEHLKKALFVWEDADPDYEPAKKAREKLKKLEATL